MDTKNSLRIKIPWSLEVRIITIVILILFGAVLFFELRGDQNPFMKILISSLLLFVTVWCICLLPRYLQIDEDGLTIKKVCGKIFIPLSDITEIAPLDPKIIRGSIRTFASGGFFGFLGKFHSTDIGSFLMYVMGRKNTILITTSKRKIVVNCSDPKLVIDFVKARKAIEKNL